jgi:hypothetical protein
MGVSAEQIDPDVSVAIGGGSTYITRLEELARAKDSLAQALADLQLGRQAREAYDEAAIQRAEAAAILARAKTDAQAMVDEARAKADAVTALSESQAEARSRALEEREVALAEREQAAQAKADALLADIRTRQEAADRATKIAQENLMQAQMMADEAKKDREAAQATIDRFTDLRTRLTAAIEDIVHG